MAALAYDPNKSCGDYGGKNQAGLPCKHPAGWRSSDDSGRCEEHDRIAEAYRTAKKAEILAILPDNGNIGQLAKKVSVPARTIWAWRQADPEFREQFEALVTARDRERAADVEDKVYERIMGDKASPAETIFFLKNRDPDRWRDVFENKGRGPIMGPGTSEPLPEIDSAKGKLSQKLKDMARRTAEAVTVSAEQRAAATRMEEEAAARVREESAGDDDA